MSVLSENLRSKNKRERKKLDINNVKGTVGIYAIFYHKANFGR